LFFAAWRWIQRIFRTHTEKFTEVNMPSGNQTCSDKFLWQTGPVRLFYFYFSVCKLKAKKFNFAFTTRVEISLFKSLIFRYIKLYGHKFSKEDHIRFIQTLFEVLKIDNLEGWVVSKIGWFYFLHLWISLDDYLSVPYIQWNCSYCSW